LNVDPDTLVLVFLGMVALAVAVSYFPPRDRRSGPRIAISAAQTAYCAQFYEWTEFSEAADRMGPESEKDLDTVRRKCNELRLELATAQRILMRKVDNGKHYVKYFRAEDATTFVPGGRS
jgi:erythromycin esterase-like protein